MAETGLGIKDKLIEETPLNPGGGLVQNFREVSFGAGSSIAKFNDDGFFVGAVKWADAPFRVDFQGNVVANSITIGGGSGIANLSDAGALAVKDSVGATDCDTTIISGGKIITGLLTADNIQTGTLNASVVSVTNLNADNITAGTITGRTLRTAAPAAGVGSSVVINGGNNEMIHFYYNATETATIKGYTTEGSETTYLAIEAASGRNIKLKNSFISCNGNFNPSTDEGYNLGTSGTKWANVYANKLFQQNSAGPGNSAYVYDFGYVEMGLLPKKMIKKHLGGIDGNGLMPVDKAPIEDIKLPFSLGTILVWGKRGLEASVKDEDLRVVAVASDRGLPIVLGAEPVRVVGRVKRGDYIVSTKNGCGKASKNPDSRSIIGIALEGKVSQEERLIKVMIRF
jgi:hypothetical protein